MLSRRRFLRTLLLTLAAPTAGGLLRSTTPAAAPGIHLVNGWILTSSDLEAITRHAR